MVDSRYDTAIVVVDRSSDSPVASTGSRVVVERAAGLEREFFAVVCDRATALLAIERETADAVSQATMLFWVWCEGGGASLFMKQV